MSETDTGTIDATDSTHSTTGSPAPWDAARDRPIPPPPTRQRRPAAPNETAGPSSARAEAAAIMVMVRPWIDPVVDEVGHDPHSRYVEQFWLGVLGPTATWLIRRLASGLSACPDGYPVDLAATARSMGLSYSLGRSSPFAKALQRCTMFGLTHQTSDGIAVRRRIPTVAHRHLRRMPPAVQSEHAAWHEREQAPAGFARAHQLAIAMLDAGDDPAAIEHQLVAIGVDDATAADVAENAAGL